MRFALLLLLCLPVFSRNCTPLVGSTNEGYEHLKAIIEGFDSLKAGTAILHEQSARTRQWTPENLTATVTEFMVGMKQASEDYECAATLASRFAKSKDEQIALSAQSTEMVYRKLVTLNKEMSDLLKRFLDKTVPASEMAETMSTNSVARDEAFRLLMQTTSLATFPLIITPKKESEGLRKLTITLAQRNELNKQLETTYGPQIKKGYAAGLKLADSPAYLIYGWLNKNWEFAQ